MSFWCRNDPPCVGQAVEPPTAGAQLCNRRGCSGPNDKPRQVETLPSGTRRGRFGLVDLPTDRILTKKEAFNIWTFLVEEHHLLISQLAATQLWLLAVRSWGLPTVWVDNPAVSTFFNILQVPQEPIKKKKNQCYTWEEFWTKTFTRFSWWRCLTSNINIQYSLEKEKKIFEVLF